MEIKSQSYCKTDKHHLQQHFPTHVRVFTAFSHRLTINAGVSSRLGTVITPWPHRSQNNTHTQRFNRRTKRQQAVQRSQVDEAAPPDEAAQSL
ncbi:hypothetical protein R3I94_007915 [Phoxinus phoxinus]|uniref:Uncharacterized protein n=1 Tax=Phoxinus phoxinus TaxID=58324 RepID=A0AAN9C997_9TELE